MMRARIWPWMVGAVVTLACGFDLTGPFEGFDGNGSRLSGRFASDAAAGSGAGATAATVAAGGAFEGIRVIIRERSSLATTVGADGSFVIIGVPAGAWTLVFERDERVIGEMRFQSVRSNQEIRIVVTIADGQVVLVEENRDQVSFDGECPRGPGFWCQNQGGQNPNLTADQFAELSEEAADLLASVPALDTADEIAAAVCNTGDQLLRQLATLALNLAAGALTRDTALEGEAFATVGAAFDAAVTAATGGGNREQIKNVLDRINNKGNHQACEDDIRDDDPGDGDDDGGDDRPPTGARCSNVQIPRGQFPPPGECKIWDPRLPAGQQGPPGNCDTLCRNKPSGTCVINHNGDTVC